MLFSPVGEQSWRPETDQCRPAHVRTTSPSKGKNVCRCALPAQAQKVLHSTQPLGSQNLNFGSQIRFLVELEITTGRCYDLSTYSEKNDSVELCWMRKPISSRRNVLHRAGRRQRRSQGKNRPPAKIIFLGVRMTHVSQRDTLSDDLFLYLIGATPQETGPFA